ncbi:KHG/KDPG aldolase-like [Lolium rigidum]|uniref:KHG/KDPG aldolase-like n=1 Tax=Lolium rigidum TaxID=89674 RepID=UPI001F5C81E8|nr:KHG/KDPG aldolase-like [Lolium rigidum]XP_047049397.1 KHG/KDPG aldolase-like [Lolium rigidum]
MSTPGVLEIVEDLRRSYPSLTFGVGTVLNADDAKKAITAGAQFLMSPGTVMEILRDLEQSEVLYIPGVLTPTEVISARDAGAEVVKVYPVSVMGGEMYMSALKKPFPLLPMVASQGITIGSIKSYMEAGASAVVLSDAIFNKQLIRERNFIGISALANQATLQASQSGR